MYKSDGITIVCKISSLKASCFNYNLQRLPWLSLTYPFVVVQCYHVQLYYVLQSQQSNHYQRYIQTQRSLHWVWYWMIQSLNSWKHKQSFNRLLSSCVYTSPHHHSEPSVYWYIVSGWNIWKYIVAYLSLIEYLNSDILYGPIHFEYLINGTWQYLNL